MDHSSSALDVLLAQVRYEHRARVRDDVLAVLDDVRSLIPVLGTLIANDGAESRLLLLSGTIPIYFQAIQYNIPVDIFVPEAYPRQPPKIYVRPTANMIVHPNHAQVDKEGMVYLPYLADWHAHAAAGSLDPSSMGGRAGFNLSELLVLVASVFSEHPPLFTRPPQQPAQSATSFAVGSSVNAFNAQQRSPPPKSKRDLLEEQLTARLQVHTCTPLGRSLPAPYLPPTRPLPTPYLPTPYLPPTRPLPTPAPCLPACPPLVRPLPQYLLLSYT